MNVSGSAIKHLLESGNAFVRPDHALADLEPSLAVSVPSGALHSIASHVAHLAWWQRQVVQDIETNAATRVRIEGEAFPSITTSEDWTAVRDDFLSSLEQLKAFCDDAQILERQYLNRDSVAVTLLDFAVHNAYHLGQIVLLRRELGAWPPAGYDPETW